MSPILLTTLYFDQWRNVWEFFKSICIPTLIFDVRRVCSVLVLNSCNTRCFCIKHGWHSWIPELLECENTKYFIWKNKYFSLILNSLSSLFAVDAVCWYNLIQSNNCLICILLFDCLLKPVIIVSKLQCNNYMNVLNNNKTHDTCAPILIWFFFVVSCVSHWLLNIVLFWLNSKMLWHYQWALYGFVTWFVEIDMQWMIFVMTLKLWLIDNNITLLKT